jgi:hypothetical protein
MLELAPLGHFYAVRARLSSANGPGPQLLTSSAALFRPPSAAYAYLSTLELFGLIFLLGAVASVGGNLVYQCVCT